MFGSADADGPSAGEAMFGADDGGMAADDSEGV